MNSRIEEFRLTITDAWFHYDNGLDTIVDELVASNLYEDF